MPRLRAVYDLTGDGKTSLKGGWGRYVRTRTVDEIQQVDTLAPGSITYAWHDLNNNKLYDVGEVNLNPNGPDFVRPIFRGPRGWQTASSILI